MLEQGDKAPSFEMSTNGGGSVSLAGLKGKQAVLYFYPKDNTSGCAIKANEFSSLTGEFDKEGVVVIGVSPDTVSSHDKFCTKRDLKHILASDPDTKVSRDYGVWAEKSMYGRKYMGVERSTFLIGKDGRLERVWRKVKAPGHAAEVLAAAQELAR